MSQPNVARGLLHIHHIITRGLEVSLAKSREFSEHGFPDASMRTGFANYVRAFASVLRAHHMTEDELAFPYFRSKLPGLPYDKLQNDHHTLEPMLPKLEALAGEIESNPQPTGPLTELHSLLTALGELWYSHIRMEEENFPESLLAQMMTVEEHLSLLQQAGAHSQKIAKPDYLVVPFMLYNLNEEERREFSRALPPVVVEQLVPVAWKDQWASMRPFLLA